MKVTHPLVVIYGLSFLSISACIASVEFFGAMANGAEENIWMILLFFFLFFVIGTIPLIAVIHAVLSSFEEFSRRELLSRIIASYISIVVVFSGVYYVMIAISDHNHYVGEKVFIQTLPKALKSEPYPFDDRAFRGFSSGVFAGIEHIIINDRELHKLPQLQKDKWEKSRMSKWDGPVFLPENRWLTLADSFYFSVVTITTLGYGDIVPTKWYSKLAVAIETLLGMILLIVAFGIAMSDWHSNNSRENDKRE